jgi:hypothetical protein
MSGNNPVSLIRDLSCLLYRRRLVRIPSLRGYLLVGSIDAAVEQLPNIHWWLVNAAGEGKLHPTCTFEDILLRTPVLFETQ